MLQPKRSKFRKVFRGRRKGAATTGSTVSFGEFGLKAMEADWITARQIEAARIAVTRHLRRGGQVWVRVFPDKSVSKKPAEVRMGGGKAAVDHWVDRKSTRLNSSHKPISYAVFCLKKKIKKIK